MLKNAYLLAKIGTDTAENERNFAEISNIAKEAGNYPMGPICPVVQAQLQAGWQEFGTVESAVVGSASLRRTERYLLRPMTH